MFDSFDSQKIHLLFSLFFILIIILFGTLTVYLLEGWSLIDCAYWAVMTITTVGDSTHIPLAATKVFSIFYVFFGVSLVFYTMLQVAVIILDINHDTARKIHHKIKKLPSKFVKDTKTTLRKMKYKI